MHYLITFVIWLLPWNSANCSCEPPEVNKAFERSDLVLSGKIIDREVFSKEVTEPIDDMTHEVAEFPGVDGFLFKPIEVFKGRPGSTELWVLTSQMPCGPSLKVGSTYIVYIHEGNLINSTSSDRASKLWTGFCSGTKLLSSSKGKLDLKFLRN